MFRESGSVALVELAVYSTIAVISMVNSGQGSGVAIAFIPFFWLLLAARLWVGLWVAAALSPNDGVQFIVAAAAVGLLSTILVSLLLAGNTKEWGNTLVLLPSLLAHISAAALVLRRKRDRSA